MGSEVAWSFHFAVESGDSALWTFTAGHVCCLELMELEARLKHCVVLLFREPNSFVGRR